MPPFNLSKVRNEFYRLDREKGNLCLDRVPTREDLYARWHWFSEKRLLKNGRNPSKHGIGRTSWMVSGIGKPKFNENQPFLEYRFRYDPMPIEWFDNPAARKIFRDPDPEHGFLEHMCAKHLAGWEDRPSGKEMYRMLREGTTNPNEREVVREFLVDLYPEVFPQLRREDALSIWHIAKAALDSNAKRGALSWWLNQFAKKPNEGATPYPDSQ